MPEITYPATFVTVHGQLVTYTEPAQCGHCSESLTDHAARNLSCGPVYPLSAFRAWGTNDELVRPGTADVGQTLSANNTLIAATLVGVGGRFRAGTTEYEVLRLPGTTTEAHPAFPDNAIVRQLDGMRPTPFPIVPELYRPASDLIATRVGTETTAHNLFIAVAMAGGPGGRIANAGGTLRILAADQDENGQVRVTSADDESGAILLRYSEFTDAAWTVVATAEANADATEPVPAPATPTIIPRTRGDALARIAALENLAAWIPEEHNTGGLRMLASLRTIASWLDGGERQVAGHDIAENHPEGNLCGSYEGLVCQTFGWSPRRSRGRWQTQIDRWSDNARQFEQDNAHLGTADILDRYAALYAPGALLNQAANDYIESNLEEHKISHVADLFAKIGWDAPDVPPEEHDYEVRVPMTRTVTMQETGYAYVTVTARDEDSALELVGENYDSRDLARNVDDWTLDYDTEQSDDYSADADFYSAEVV